jgi:glycine/D-amino acid oxidase-like deaminating enzyme
VFDYKDLHIEDTQIVYKGSLYDHVVFCGGYRALTNPLFNWLEIYPMKGEYLVCHIPDLELQYHLKSKVSLIPLAEKDMYWCGATYDRYNEDPRSTEAGRNYLLKHLREIVQLPITIEHHGAGIRATTRDRRPYVGTHPQHSRIHLITGLGTKGASLAPYCAHAVADLLENGKAMPPEIDLLRHMI